MIGYLLGTIAHISPTELTIEVNGVGYTVNIPLSTYEALHDSNGIVKVYTHLHVREDALLLFGFATDAERGMFQLLLSVTGIGPKMAQVILSGISVPELRSAVGIGRIESLTSISGVGRKTAERMIMELRDKISAADLLPPPTAAGSARLKVQSEAVVALMSLGHSRATAEEALRKALADSPAKELSVEELIKRALQYTSRK